jgi:hypothetical protein
MTWGLVGAAAVTTAGGLLGQNKAAKGAEQASQQQQAAIGKATAIESPIAAKTAPALDTLTQGFAPGGQFTKQFTMQDAITSPAEQHALEQGTQAIQNSAAARGGLLGTNTLEDLTKFGQGNAAQYEQQAFNQWLAQQQQQISGLQGLSGANIGATENLANLQLGSGAAQAAGTVGKANAAGGMVSDLTSQMGLMAGLFGSKMPAPTPAAPQYNPDTVANIGQGASFVPNYSMNGSPVFAPPNLPG